MNMHAHDPSSRAPTNSPASAVPDANNRALEIVNAVEIVPVESIEAITPSEVYVAGSTTPDMLRTQYHVSNAPFAERDRRPASCWGGRVHAPEPLLGAVHVCARAHGPVVVQPE